MSGFISRRGFLYAVGGAAVSLPFAGCGKSSSPHWPGSGLRVAVSFPPYYCFAANVLGQSGTVKTILTSQGPHHEDSNLQERAILESADLFIINGLDLDDALANRLKGSTGNSKLKIEAIGNKLPCESLLVPGEGCCQHKNESGEAHNHPHDPHIWLSPKLAMEIVKEIRSVIRLADRSNAELYDANAKVYLEALEKLHTEATVVLKSKSNRKIVTMHGSMGYLALAYNLEISGVIQKSPGQDPNDNEFKELIKKCLNSKTRVIAVEPQYPSKNAAELLKSELTKAGIADVEIIELDPLETATVQELNPQWYETKMRKNIETLGKVLR